MAIKIGEKKILRSPLEPKDKNWLWLKTVAGFPVLYEYLSGKWIPFSDATAEYMETHILSRVFGSTRYDKDNHCIEFYAADGSDVPIGVIDTSEFEVSIDADDYYTKAEVEEYVSEYVSEHGGASADLSDYYTSSDVDTLLSGKVSVVSGKGLSTNDYTTDEKTKLSGIATGAEVNVQPNWTQTNTSADDYIKNKPTLATVATSGAYSDLSGTPTIPTKVSDLTNDSGFTSNAGTVTGISVNGGAAQQPTNGVVNLTIATGGDNDIVGISDGTASDGAVVFSKRNGDTVTLDFNHSHPQYALANSLSTVATSGDYDDLTGKPTKVSDFTNDSGFTSNTGTITGITMNGASKGTSGVVNLGTVITAHQDISGKANKSEMAVSTSGDQTTITLKTGTSATVINQHQSLSGYAKYVLLADEAAYTALSTKDSGTLYLIPES